MEDKDSKSLKSTFYFKWIFASLVVLLLLLACSFYSAYLIRKMQESYAENAKRITDLQEQMKLVAESNILTVFELEQMGEMQRMGDSLASTDNGLKRKLDSLERQNFHNALVARLEAVNASALNKAQDDSKQLYANYLTHINSILGFFGVLIALITIFVPYLINRKTDEVIKEHEKKLNKLIEQTNESAEKAKQSVDETLAISEIASYNNTAMTFMAKGEYDRALDYYKTAVIQCETKLGKNHLYMATTYNNIAEVYYNKGDYDEALPYFNKALEIRETKLGKDHPDTAIVYNNIALVYHSKGDYDNALKYYEKALEIEEVKLGKDHPETASTYNNIASVYSNKNDYNNALKYHKKALEIRETKLGKNHPDTATTYNNIGYAYVSNCEYDNALDYCVKAIKIWLNRDYCHPDAKLYFDNMKFCYNQSKKKQPFEDWMKGQLDDKEWEAFSKLMDGK
jgi:tetratricopeptide (TPR) repeat protein